LPEPFTAQSVKFAGGREFGQMIGKEYLLRQAQTLLKLAQATRNRQVAAKLTEKAAELRERSDRVERSDAEEFRQTG
jgi:predicted nucleic acid-binding protein